MRQWLAWRLWLRGMPPRLYLLLADWPYRLQFSDTFAFGAECLISHYPATWMILYADQVIISGQPSMDAILSLLYSSGVGKHTLLIHLNKTSDSMGNTVIKTSQYVWEHKFQWPHTFSYPIACPLCHHVYPWQNINSHTIANGSSFLLKCKTKLRNGQKCEGTWEILAHPESSVVESPYVGSWRVM